MNFHNHPNSFVGGEKPHNFSFEAMRSGYIEEYKNSDFQDEEPEEDDVDEFDHDICLNIILNIANSIRQSFQCFNFSCSSLFTIGLLED